MTIEKEGYLYCLYCDICGEKANVWLFFTILNHKMKVKNNQVS